MFLAVALAAATSMGLGGNNALLRAISQETRHVVAQVLESSSSNKHLYIANGRLCTTNDLLQQATREVGLKDDDTDQYLKLLRTEGSKGGIQGGGPELTVLANVLRRPISIYELAAQPLSSSSSNSKNATTASHHHHHHHSSSSSSSKHNKEQQQQQQQEKGVDVDDDEYCCNIVCKGTFGKDLFSDPCASIPDSAVLMPNLQPGAYSWELHILILNVSTTTTAEEKHACVLLPQSPI